MTRRRPRRRRSPAAGAPRVSVAALSSPLASGGAGVNFENQVQTAFVILMLTGGIVPAMPSWPIKKIVLQGRYAGFATDDMVVFLESAAGQGKLLTQIKFGAAITETDDAFGDAIRAALSDFRNPKAFSPGNDALALVTGPLTGRDQEARIVLDWARGSATADEFFRKVALANFSNDAKREKLKAFRAQLKRANRGRALADAEVWDFLKSYHILGYDLDVKSGVSLSLLHSHVAQFNCGDIPAAWGEVSREVAYANQNAGTITLATLSRSVQNKFSVRATRVQMPADLAAAPAATVARSGGDEILSLLIGCFLGAWNDKVPGDLDAVRKLIE